MSKDTNTKEIVIDLSDSSNAKSFKEGNVIHQEALQKVTDFILEFQEANDKTLVEIARNKDKKIKLSYKHNTITILGTRGSGKTSFLLSIEDAIKEEKKIRYDDLLFLDIIDPTLVEEKGHVFLNVISCICEEVKVVLDKKEVDLTEDVKCIRKKWKESMTKLAKGLPSIDGIGNSKFGEWQDAEFVMQNELQAIHSARNLGNYFADFVRQSLNIIDKKQFVLFFDDIDVDSSKGYNVLETIRKYFISDQLISFLSGDLKLYDTLVRDKKWNNFSDKLITYECSTTFQDMNVARRNRTYYNDIVTDLTSQYLIKIMQPKYRANLNTLFNYYRKNPNITVKKIANNDILLSKFLEDIFKNFGIVSTLQRATFEEFLLKQPLRTIVHFLQLFNKESVDIDNLDIIAIFQSDLYEKHLDINAMQGIPTYFITILLEFLLREERLKDSYQFMPTTLDNSFNAVLFSSSLLFSQHVKAANKFIIFEYFYKIAYLRQLLEGNFLNNNLTDIVKKSRIYTDNVLRDSSNQLQCSLFGEYESIKEGKSKLGLIVLYSLNNFTENITLTEVVSDQSSIKKIISYIPCFIGKNSTKQASTTFYSILSLFSTIGELLKRYENGVLEKKDFIPSLIELSQIRYYSIDDYSDFIEEVDPIDYSDDNQEEVNVNNETAQIYILLKKWFDNRMTVDTVSPYLLGKIFTRFYNSLIGMDLKAMNLGEIFHLQIVTFLNSLIIEESRENNLSNFNLNIDNIRSSTKLFKNNLSKLSINRNKLLPLSLWFLSCPLLLAYLDNDTVDYINKFLDRKSLLSDSDYKEIEVFSILIHVNVK